MAKVKVIIPVNFIMLAISLLAVASTCSSVSALQGPEIIKGRFAKTV